ncbi:amidohydrolase family protein [Limimaricola sp. G21655-S1]|uniref:amidohydrolase family protein n=1 Tax=Limimaricola sp. G21655-S1 TaxID=3014768 RepID=UPI0022AF2CE0|nr:amidohydrolase family protein [Limimaricola sp. G21655-S1]MCZ4260630.1 amidohydrolase family protein [Limimaricola sp. G21655-S1]
MTIDAHQHFWQVARGDYGWMTPDQAPLLRDFTPADLAPLNRAAGIDRTILVQAAETEAETDFLLGIAARCDFVAGVVGWLDMTAPSFPERLTHYVAQPKWVGLRPMLQDHDPTLITTLAFREALAEVARRDIPFDILTFPRHLPMLLETLAATPPLRGIIDHLSKPDMTRDGLGQWGADMTRLAAHPGLYCKVSGLVTEAGPGWSAERIRPWLRHVAGLFGPRRLVFGTDWPVCTLAASHAEVTRLARDLLGELYGPEDMARIFETNAIEFYKLKAA